jgi:hypothetical protein
MAPMTTTESGDTPTSGERLQAAEQRLDVAGDEPERGAEVAPG